MTTQAPRRCEVGNLVRILNAGIDDHLIGKTLPVVRTMESGGVQQIWVWGSRGTWYYPDPSYIEWIDSGKPKSMPNQVDYYKSVTGEL